MPPVKDYFDNKKREKLLEEAIKKAKGKGKFTFAFGIGKSGSCMALDFRNEHSVERFLKEIKKTEFNDKYIVGTASINGKSIEMKSLHSKNNVKPVDAKAFLASVKSSVSRAVIDGKGDDDDEPRNGSKATVSAGEISVIKQIPLGSIYWGRRYRGKFWGLVDTQGVLLTSGKTPQTKGMARLNTLGKDMLKTIAEVEGLDGKWQAQFGALREAAKQATSDLKKLEKALPAMRRRNKNGDFHEDVDGYLSALTETEKIIRNIPKAEQDFKKAAEELNQAVFELSYDDAQKKYEVVEKDLKQLESDMEEAKQIFKDVMDIAIEIAKQDWQGLATRAVSYLGEKSIEAEYAPRLKKLHKQLDAAKQEMTRLKTAGLVSGVNAKRHGLESAAIAFENVQKELKEALDRLARKRTNARNELKESSSTRIAGELIDQRAQQLRLISSTQDVCKRYLRFSKLAARDADKLAGEYSRASSLLSDASQKNSAWDISYKSALSNTVELNQWTNWVKSVQQKCEKAQAWVGDDGSKGPMAPFDKVISLLNRGLS